MIVAQLTDLHLTPDGTRVFGLVDTTAMARAAVDHVNALDPRPAAVIVTGDVAEDGSPDSYAATRTVLDRLRAPWFAVPGNHDRRDPFVAHLAARTHDGFVQYTVEDQPIRLVALDSLDEGRAGGRLCDSRLDWLAATLTERTDAPTIVFVHHPPLPVGMVAMDADRLQGFDRLCDVIAGAPQVQVIACGHLHRNVGARLPGTGARVSVAGSTAHQVALTLGPDPTLAVSMEPPSVLLHTLVEGEIVTHTSLVGWRLGA